MTNLHQSVVDQVHARIGKTLKDKWHIDALIGMGGMAAVYSATHRTGGRVAIKVLHPALSMNDSVRRRFSREGYVANKIGHPGVAHVLDDDVAEDGSAFLVMELLEGETAASRAERCGGKLNPSEVSYIGEAVLEVLAAAHKVNVIHRDIKPDNVFITNDGRVVVLDFGIARLVDTGGVSESATRTGTMMGTPAFMPPEQARGRANEMDASSDVWALGATLFWLASGRVVHEAETPNEQLVAAATLPAPPLSRAASNFPSPIGEVIDKSLEFAKENRFHDAAAMKSALHEAVLSVSWGNRRPSLDFSIGPASQDADETVVEVGKPLKPLAPKLPMSGEDAPTIDTRARGPTIGPVEMSPPAKRSAQYLKAGLIGLVAAVVILGATTVVAKKVNTASVAAATAPTVPGPTVPVATVPVATVPVATSVGSSSPSPSTSTSTSTIASASAEANVHAAHTGHSAVPPTTSRNNWLDRRK